MPTDRLSELLVPNLIDRFDAIPVDQRVTIELTKGELAYLIKSQYQLHNGLAALLTALGDVFYQTDVGNRALQQAAAALQGAQESMALATNPLIERAVRSAYES